MTPLTERLMWACHRNDNINAIILARFKHKFKLSKIFIIQKPLDELNLLKMILIYQ